MNPIEFGLAYWNIYSIVLGLNIILGTARLDIVI